MPKLTETNTNNKCSLCGQPAKYISINSKKYRCVEKITQCPGFIKKAEASRQKNITPEQRLSHMKNMSVAGNKKLKILHSDPLWLSAKSNNISNSVKERGGHEGKNNPMFNKHHSKSSIEKLKVAANGRDPNSYKRATETKILNGIAIDKSLKSQWQLYEEQVDNLTRMSWNKFKNIINPNNIIRGKDYELDHRYSKLAGFNNDISPGIIAHYCNLEILLKKDNRSKSSRCSVTLKDLNKSIELSNRTRHPH